MHPELNVNHFPTSSELTKGYQYFYPGRAWCRKLEHEHCRWGDHWAQQGWPRILEAHQVRNHSFLSWISLLYFDREEWSSSQLISPTAGLDNLATFTFRGFKGYYSFRFLLDGEQYGDGMNVTIEEDKVLRCDFNDGFDMEACSGQ